MELLFIWVEQRKAVQPEIISKFTQSVSLDYYLSCKLTLKMLYGFDFGPDFHEKCLNSLPTLNIRKCKGLLSKINNSLWDMISAQRTFLQWDQYHMEETYKSTCHSSIEDIRMK